MSELVVWCYKIGMQCAAFVYSPNQLKDYQINRITKHRHGHLERQTFSSAEKAFAWLEQKGFSVSQPERLTS